MHGIQPIDPGRRIDWGKTSDDYAAHRPGPPDSLYVRLAALGIGLAGQRLLDLGTGTGVIARRMASQGAHVTGIDVALEQVAAARRLARAEGLDAQFVCAPAEAAPFAAHAFDAVTANQCWLYFDKATLLPQLRRVLAPSGLVVTSHNCWLPRRDRLAARTEALVLKYNPAWTGADWLGIIPDVPTWTRGEAKVRATFYYDEPVPFTRESWRGRIRACRGVGATLAPDEVARFDAELEELLKNEAAETFEVLHRIDAHVCELIG